MQSSATSPEPVTRNSLLIGRMKMAATNLFSGVVRPLPISDKDEDVLAALRGWEGKRRPYPHGDVELLGWSAYVKCCSRCGGKHFLDPKDEELWDPRDFVCVICKELLTDVKTTSYNHGVYVGGAEKDGKVVLEWKAECKACHGKFFLTHADNRRMVPKGTEVKRRKASAASIPRAPESYDRAKVKGKLPMIYFCDRCDTEANAAKVKKLTKQHARDAKIVAGGPKALKKRMKESGDRAVARHLGEAAPAPKKRTVKRAPRTQSSLDITPAMLKSGKKK